MERLLWLDAGASGALESDPQMVLLGARSALTQLLSPYVRSRLADAKLTQRESEVLACVAVGKTNAEAAALLSITSGTVKKHLEHIYKKLGAGSRTEAVATALGIRLHDPGVVSLYPAEERQEE
jgi:DNA-binding CsgD family transcriptional regulator